jgi:uncharacterized membrane protein YdjX (TVP38/TMEM64 family)
MTTSTNRLLISLLLVLMLAILAVLASRYSSLDWFVRNDRWLRTTIQSRPFQASMIAFAAYMLLSLVPGLAGKSIVVGWLFGMVKGVVIVNVALVTAGIIAFLLSRHFLKSAVQSRFGVYLRAIQKRVEQDGAMYLLTLRLAHAPFSFLNYAAGAATDIPVRTFWWTTQVGLLPGNLVFVYAGTRLPTLEELVASGPLSLLDGPLIAALSGTVFVPWLVRRLLRLLPSAGGPARQLPEAKTTDNGGKAT